MARTLPSCLVIGGAGNLGSQIVDVLVERKYPKIATFDLAPYHGAHVDRVASFSGDINDQASLENAIRTTSAQVIFHTASIIDIRPVPSPKMQLVNVEGTRTILAAVRATATVRALVYTSSIEVVSGKAADGKRQDLSGGCDETVPIPVEHHLPYAATKAQAELLVLTADGSSIAGRERPLLTCAIRPGYIMGAGAIGHILDMHLAHESRGGYYVGAKLPAIFPTVHGGNCARMHVMAAEKIEQSDVHGQAFFCRDFEANIVDMTLHAFRTCGVKCLILPVWLAYLLAWLTDRAERALIKLYGWFGLRRQTPATVVDIRAVRMAYFDFVVSGEKARRALGYEPVVGREACLDEAARFCDGFYASLARSGAAGAGPTSGRLGQEAPPKKEL
ncbi:unnamed protein product [Prorocentrum cordatum]|uniref:3-beta hydroxysteroid dehydrogenase/isomerase domain-containing protein n=1 Tax=Prorocentrum cordatum TaxID=2364126 RepID=A0ABN9Q124_9DINO|nr:unnamed protein product [Polarella glacialis]